MPSITEILRTWGHDPVACTEYCEQADLAHVGGTKNPIIDDIVALAPDVVMVDKEENRREDADALRARGVELLVTDVRALADVEPTLDAIAARIGHTRAPSARTTPADSLGLRAFVPIWRRPWMTISGATFGSSLLASVGVANVFADAADTYPQVELDDVAGVKPDVMLVPSEPYVFRDSHLAELETIAPAVRIDGQDLFWWGTRTPAARARLRSVLADVAAERQG